MNLGMETETVEHKKSTSEMREGMESMASILNKHGRGTLYFGVRNDGEVIGQDVSEKTLRDVSQAVGNRIEPRIFPQIERLVTDDGKAYVRVEFSGFETPYSCEGRYRIRSADEDVPMSRAKLQEMMRDAENRSNPWDGRSSGRTVADVNEDLLRRYFERGVEARRITFEYVSARQTLSRLGLLCDDGTLTNAAWVCFTDRPQIGLRMGVLADSNRVDIRDNQQVSGSLFALVEAAETYILNNTRRAFVIDGSSMHRREVPEIPAAAVREALMNAFCHRRYEDLGAVQVDIFWDKVDIYSPGRFPLGLAPEDYLSGEEATSKPRNPLIAATLFRSNDIEAYGTGLQRIRNACAERGAPVRILQKKDSVHVVFTRQEGVAASAETLPEMADVVPQSAGIRRNPPESAVNDGLPTPWDAMPANERRVCEYLEEKGPSSPKDISDALDMSPRTLRDIAGRLSSRGMLTKTGTTKDRTYSLNKPDHR